MSMKWLLYIFLFLSLISCIDFKQSEYTETIDLSIESLNQSKTKLDEAVFDSIPIIISEIKTIKTKIRTYLKNDTLPLNIALKIDDLNQIDKELKKIEKNIPIAKKDIDVLTLNLSNLKKDIYNGSGNRAKYAENIELEKTNQTLITNSVDVYFNNCSESIQLFNEIKNELKSFSNKLELKNKEQNLIP